MLLLNLVLFLSFTFSTNALNCWVCNNARSNQACMGKGKLQRCQENQKACQSEVRKGSYGQLITKQCKQILACDNNFAQNGQAAWYPTQCNTKSSGSVCRCCCSTDGCNAPSSGCISRPRINLRLSTCFPPRTPRNGLVQCSAARITNSGARGRMSLGTECTFRCQQGFNQRGAGKVMCSRKSTSGRARFNRGSPLCTPNTCLFPQGAPEDGDVTCTKSNEISSVCNFSCRNGFVIKGSLSSTCLATRSWSNKRPSCVRKQCVTRHNDPNNGLVTCDDATYLGSHCRFECRRGFALQGAPLSTCVNDPLSPTSGKWSTRAPICLRIKCEPQTVPFNGEVTCTNGREEGSVCEFACSLGYYLTGSSEVTCLDDKDDDEFGTWSHPPPSCRPLLCRFRRSPPNGRMRCSRFNLVGSRCRVSCNPGFDMTGTPESVCEESSERIADWSNPSPACIAIRCSPFHELMEHGSVECSNENYATSSCTFTCPDGYSLRGSQSIRCGLDGLWSSDRPTCIRNKCSPKQNSSLPTVTCSNQDLPGSVCSFACPSGYQVTGNRETTCTVVGVWSNPDPICTRKRCPPPPAPSANSVRVCSDGTGFATQCDYLCNEGYRREGANSLTCVEDLDGEYKWDNKPPSCEGVECPTLPPIHNGEVMCSNDLNGGSVCSFTCKEAEGYTLYPPNYSNFTCQSNSTWSGRLPCCARPCPPFAHMDLVLVLDSSSSIGDVKWEIMKSFVRSFINSFSVSSNTSRMSILRYNVDVDTESLIRLGDYPDDKPGLLSAYDAIPYDGRGTKTGRAVRYVNDVILKETNGDRPGVKDVVVVITDGRAQDGRLLTKESKELRQHGALVYAIGVAPGRRGSLDEQQLLAIAGSSDRVLIARSGFEELGEILLNQLSGQICDNRCADQILTFQ